MADDPVEVMKKHLRDELVPPDHINTALSAGVSEVIEVMMAKKKQDRYRSIEELLVDLRAVRAGLPPVRAHKRFDVSVLEQLEEGEAVQREQPAGAEETVARYRTMMLILGVVSAVLLLIIVMLLLR
jgi:serine/threonine-protein kinase